MVADFTADVGEDSDYRKTGKLAKGFILVEYEEEDAGIFASQEEKDAFVVAEEDTN